MGPIFLSLSTLPTKQKVESVGTLIDTTTCKVSLGLGPDATAHFLNYETALQKTLEKESAKNMVLKASERTVWRLKILDKGVLYSTNEAEAPTVFT